MVLEMEIYFFSRGTLQTEGRDVFPRMPYKSMANAHPSAHISLLQ